MERRSKMAKWQEPKQTDLYKAGYNAAIDNILEMTRGSSMFATPATEQELHQKIKDFSDNGIMTVQFMLNFLSQEINKMKEV